MPLIKINPFFWLVIIGGILTGQFLEIITLFAVVIIHELGHVFAAKSSGCKIIEIQLLPFGGVAKIDITSDSIWHELLIAVAGPLQNLIMILMAVAFRKVSLWSNDWTTFFIQANLWIGLFNLIPISPLDGNKILRSLFYLFFPYKRAIMVSAFVSIILTILFLFWSLGITIGTRINLNGVLLAVFFIVNNYLDLKQAPYVFWRFLLRKANQQPMRNISAIQIVVPENLPVMSALQLLKKDRYHLFYVINGQGGIIKIVPEEKLLQTVYQQQEIYQPIANILC